MSLLLFISKKEGMLGCAGHMRNMISLVSSCWWPRAEAVFLVSWVQTILCCQSEYCSAFKCVQNCSLFQFCRIVHRFNFMSLEYYFHFLVQVSFPIKTRVCVSTAYCCQTCWTYDDKTFVIFVFLLWYTVDCLYLLLLSLIIVGILVCLCADVAA